MACGSTPSSLALLLSLSLVPLPPLSLSSRIPSSTELPILSFELLPLPRLSPSIASAPSFLFAPSSLPPSRSSLHPSNASRHSAPNQPILSVSSSSGFLTNHKSKIPMSIRDGLLSVSWDASGSDRGANALSTASTAASRTSSSSLGSSAGASSFGAGRQLSGSSIGSSSLSRGVDSFRSLGSFAEEELHLAGLLARLHASSTSGGAGAGVGGGGGGLAGL